MSFSDAAAKALLVPTLNEGSRVLLESAGIPGHVVTQLSSESSAKNLIDKGLMNGEDFVYFRSTLNQRGTLADEQLTETLKERQQGVSDAQMARNWVRVAKTTIQMVDDKKTTKHHTDLSKDDLVQRGKTLGIHQESSPVDLRKVFCVDHHDQLKDFSEVIVDEGLTLLGKAYVLSNEDRLKHWREMINNGLLHREFPLEGKAICNREFCLEHKVVLLSMVLGLYDESRFEPFRPLGFKPKPPTKKRSLGEAFNDLTKNFNMG